MTKPEGTYHGIVSASCECGYTSSDVSTLESWNDYGGHAATPGCDGDCETHTVSWTLRDGTVSVTGPEV